MTGYSSNGMNFKEFIFLSEEHSLRHIRVVWGFIFIVISNCSRYRNLSVFFTLTEGKLGGCPGQHMGCKGRRNLLQFSVLPSLSCVTLGNHLTSLGFHFISSTETVLERSLRLRWERLECLPQRPTKVSSAPPRELLPARELTGRAQSTEQDGDGVWGRAWPTPAV